MKLDFKEVSSCFEHTGPSYKKKSKIRKIKYKSFKAIFYTLHRPE
jgi:hypothetical protein